MLTRILGLVTLVTLGAVAAAQVDPPKKPPTDPAKDTLRDPPRDRDRPGDKDRPRDPDRPRDKDSKDRPRDKDGKARPRDKGDDPDRPKRKYPFDPRRDPDGSGRLIRFDRDRRTLILGAGEGGRQTTYSVGEGAEVLIDGRPGRFEDLREGDPVRVRLNPDRSTVLSAYVGGPLQRGTVTAVNPANDTVSFRTDRGTMTVAVAAGADVIVDGGDAVLRDLREGQAISVWLARDQKTALWVMAGRGVAPAQGADPDRPREPPSRKDQPREGVAPKGSGEVTGRFRGYDARTKEVLIAGQARTKDPARYLVEKGTEVVIDGKRGAITTIPDNHMVRLDLGAGKVVARITANGPVQKRKVLAVNEERRTLQLERETDTEEVPVSPDAAIVVNGRDAKISEVQPGDVATIKFAIDRKTILGVQVGLGKPEEGKIPKN